MGNYLSSSKKAEKYKITETDRTILSLKTQRNKLNDQTKLLEMRIDRHQEVARELLREGKRDRALLALKKKKLTEHQLEQLAGVIINVENMVNNIESQKQQAKMLQVLQQGNDTLKKLQQQVSLDDVKKLMEDTAEAKAYQDELNEMLGQSLSDVDDAAVEEELSALEDQALQEHVMEMPKVPTTAPAAATKVVQKQTAQAQEEEEEQEEPAKEGRREAMLAA